MERKSQVRINHAAFFFLIISFAMGCGASKAANAANGGDITSEEVQTIASSITQIRDIAPPEVADTGAHPPRRDDIIRRNLYFQAGAGPPFAIPGVVPESDFGPDMVFSASRRGESLIKMHPPRKPQRLGLETVGEKSSAPDEV